MITIIAICLAGFSAYKMSCLVPNEVHLQYTGWFLLMVIAWCLPIIA